MSDNLWQPLIAMVKQKRLPHALLLVGNHPDKMLIAKRFANALLCPHFQSQLAPCHQCTACHLAEKETHPDLLPIQAEKSATIKIDQVREITAFVNQTAMLTGYRVIIIHPADSMNLNAANALLKTLEEPSPNVLFILISEQQSSLPATILSRCQRMIMDDANQSLNQAVDPLFYQQLLALSLGKEDPLVMAEQFHEEDAETVLMMLYTGIKTILRAKLLGDSVVDQAIMQSYTATHLTRYMDYLEEIIRYVRGGFHLNNRLMLEDLLIRWVSHGAS